MPETGIQYTKECVTEFNAMKLNKAYKYIVYGMDEKYENIIIVAKGAPDASYEEFLSHLPPKNCRYAVFNCEFEMKEGGKREKIAFISWAPSTAKIKDKMLYATTKDSFKKALVGCAIEVQANGPEDVTEENVIAKCMQFARE